MDKARVQAWAALIGLLVIVGMLLAGGLMYQSTGFWTGMMAAAGQAVVAGLAVWGLTLARQREDMNETPLAGSTERTSDFRMSLGDDSSASSTMVTPTTGVRTLETGFQRLVVVLTSIILVGLSIGIAWIVWSAFSWARLNPDKTLPVAGSYDKPLGLDELGLVLGLGAAVIYFVLFWTTRVRRETRGSGEAVHGTLLIGLGGMVALGVASVLAYLKVSYAQEVAGGIIGALLLLEGFELLANGLRSYSSVDEMDVEGVDLQELPLIPMLSSVWLASLQALFAQSVGLSRSREGGVISRMMPRAIASAIVIGILMTCIRVVKPGEVAVLERLGESPKGADGKVALLQPGLHFTMPWPIDNLVRIPTEVLQYVDVGSEMHSSEGAKSLDFSFWMFRGQGNTADEQASEFVTGDPGAPQMLETYVAILWRVKDPARFYSDISHSNFYEKGETVDTGTKALPVYSALVQQSASFAVTRVFAIHTLDQIMLNDRKEVEQHCKRILQDKLDEAGAGIEIADLTIQDLHPPFGFPDHPDYTVQFDQTGRGPASAYENVVSMREYKETVIGYSNSYRTAAINLAKGQAASAISAAQAYKYQHIATAQTDAERMTSMMAGRDQMPKGDQKFFEKLAETQSLYGAMRDVFDPVNKIIVDPSVKDLELYQLNQNGQMLVRPQ